MYIDTFGVVRTFVCVRLCVCVCVRERERERERGFDIVQIFIKRLLVQYRPVKNYSPIDTFSTV